jgi:hypothetical protein
MKHEVCFENEKGVLLIMKQFLFQLNYIILACGGGVSRRFFSSR